MSDDPDDEFRRIVEGLELELSGFEDLDEADTDEPDETDDTPSPATSRERRAAYSPEQSYEADFSGTPPPSGPIDVRLTIAWVAVGLSPLILIAATLSGVVLPRPVAYGCALLFVAAALYLFSRIPNRRDDGDDGAVV